MVNDITLLWILCSRVYYPNVLSILKLEALLQGVMVVTRLWQCLVRMEAMKTMVLFLPPNHRSVLCFQRRNVGNGLIFEPSSTFFNTGHDALQLDTKLVEGTDDFVDFQGTSQMKCNWWLNMYGGESSCKQLEIDYHIKFWNGRWREKKLLQNIWEI